jgi:hypothetical protein
MGLAVDNFEAVKAFRNNKLQQLSTSGGQTLQQQSLRNNKFQQVPTETGIWFGTRGSGIQIPSPRPTPPIAYGLF